MHARPSGAGEPTVEHDSVPDWRGQQLEVVVGPIAHGGHCVARHHGRVVFVRHALPGERVIATVTEDHGGSYCRADATAVLSPSPERVTAPCRYSGPGGCGGCDFQHVATPEQRRLKAAVVSEQLRRLAGLDWPVVVRELAPAGLGWRRRVRYVADGDGNLGLRKYRSHDVVAVRHCAIAAPGVADAAGFGSDWPRGVEVEVAVDDNAAVAVLRHPDRSGQPSRRQGGRSSRRRDRGRQQRAGAAEQPDQVGGPPRLSYQASGRRFHVRPSGFWQTHPQAADEYVSAVLAGAALAQGERALDLYAGAGLFTAALAGAVGRTGQVMGLEGDARAAADAAGNLADLAWAEVRCQPVTAATVAELCDQLSDVAAIVADPPRTGVGKDVMAAMLAAEPRAIVYVACDPAALARDLRVALDSGWTLSDLTAFDAFPMTHHVECVAVLAPPQG